MKKLLAILLLLIPLTGCTRIMDDYEPKAAEYRVCAGCYPIYALARMVVRDVPDISLSCLIQPQDGCLRSYQLSEWDALRAADLDCLILGGRGLETWQGVVTAWENGPIVLTVMDGLTLRNEGVTAKDEDSDHFDTEDPWLFLSPVGAMDMLRSIAVNMMEIDPDYAELYQRNLDAALAETEGLAIDMLAACGDAEGVRFAVLQEGIPYLADFLGLETVYTFHRESGEDVIGNMLASLLDSLSENRVDVVLLEVQAPAALVSCLEEAGYRVCLIDTLSAHGEDSDTDYITVMLQNAQAVASVLQSE